MAGKALTVQSTLQCPHGGAVQIIPTNTRVRADGGFVATIADTTLISGCPFQIPGTPPIPSPCVTVQWVVGDTRVKASGNLTLSESSVGMCLAATQAPQGPVTVASTQQKASTM